MIRHSIALSLVLAVIPVMTNAATPAQTVIKQSEEAMGFIDFYYQNQSGELFLEAKKLNEPF